jgi:hypothetical protein
MQTEEVEYNWCGKYANLNISCSYCPAGAASGIYMSLFISSNNVFGHRPYYFVGQINIHFSSQHNSSTFESCMLYPVCFSNASMLSLKQQLCRSGHYLLLVKSYHTSYLVKVQLFVYINSSEYYSLTYG